jgi:flavin reductase (DIM6/NTAB) family NADH-FMN oxidoreductase RutF
MTEAGDPVLRQLFLDGMSHAASTVNVVTTDGAGGRAGVTVSAMASVSADTPQPTLLVCVHHQSRTARPIVTNGVFCVNVLRDDQSYISDIFAGRRKMPDGDPFSCASWATQVTGAPRVADPLVAFDCRLEHHMRVGTHHVFFGAVADIFLGSKGLALIHANRAYGSPAALPAQAAAGSQHADAVGTLRLGCFQTIGPYLVPAVLARLRREHGAADVRLVEGDQRRILKSLRTGETEIALLFDLDLPDDLEREPLGELRPYVLLPEGHELAARTGLTLPDLVDQPLVLLDMPPSRDYFLSLFASAGLAPTVAYRSASFEMVRGLVGHGLGYSLLATKPANNITYDGQGLVIRHLDGDIRSSRLVLAWPRRRELSRAAAAFGQCCRAHLLAFH